MKTFNYYIKLILKRKISIFIIIFSGGIFNSAFSQTQSDSIKAPKNNSKDLLEILGLANNKTFNPDSTNTKDLGPFFSVVPVVGYSIATGLTAALINNISFYTNNQQDKLSSIQTSFFYSQYHQYWATVNSNVFIKRIKANLVGDWRFYRFPTKTFGLGSNTDLDQPDKIDYYYIKVHQLLQHEFFPNVFFGVGYHLDDYWKIKEFAPAWANTDFQRYGFTKHSKSSGASVDFLFDDRTNSVNPDKGNYLSFQYRVNRVFLGSDKDWQSIIVDARKYFKFPANTDNVLAFWSYNYFTFNGKPPYLDLPSTGWDSYNNTGRGYIQGRFRGKDLIYFESEYRFAITQDGLIGGVVFLNQESASEWLSNRFSTIQPGFGGGVRIKVNKHSKVSLAIDYGFGTQGSKGLSFNLGELF
jgi:hypothetical protein